MKNSMAQEKDKRISRNVERFFILLISVLLGLLFFNLYTVLNKEFSDVDSRLSQGTMVNLNAPNPDQRIKTLLERGYYFEDRKDIELIRSIVSQRLNTESKIENIGELNKLEYYVDADQAFSSGGESFKKRVLLSRNLLGYSGADSLRFEQEKKRPLTAPSSNSINMGKYTIDGTILDNEENPVSGVLVRLEMI
ncbi:MAG TPA: hypothetical protein VM888_11575, partial [Chitinophagaceae bacterium]|nr:hypothetical protein [Chitinophagaceae bacterium]